MSLLQEALSFLQQVSVKSFSEPFLIGRGTERLCFFLPNNPTVVLKISKDNFDKQTYREINYFKFLANKKVPFAHLPHFFQEIRTPEYHCFLQERVLNEDGTPSPTLYQYLKDADVTDKKVKAAVLQLLKDFFCYIYRYNIIPCDLQMVNLLIKRTQKGSKLIFVDGLGSTDAINISQYIAWWGRKKILRKTIFFLKNNPKLASLFNTEQDIEPWVYEQIKNPRS